MFLQAPADIVAMVVRSSQIDLMAKVLDATSLRHSAIAQNLANANTPNYRRVEVQFETEVERALEQGDVVVSARPNIVESQDAVARADGNTVDIDVEISQLNKNSLLMAAATQILALQLAQLRSAISGK